MTLVQTREALEAALGRMRQAPWAAVDTEGDSLHHYKEKLCLVQVSVPGEDFIFDPLVPLDLSGLTAMLSQKSVILLHGADFDVRILRRTFGFEPTAMFDTLVAAQILGYPKQGYADLVERHIGVKLSKSPQKADWSARPLEPKLLEYASNDTRHLDTLRTIMTAELVELGRLDWCRQTCARILDYLKSVPTSPEEPTGREWQIRGSKELKGLSLTILQRLWHWREEEAGRRDRPSFKIMNTDYLSQLAAWAGAHPDADVAEWNAGPRQVKGQYRDVLNKLIREARTLPQAVWKFPPKGKPDYAWGEKENRLIGALKTAREEKAKALAIHPSLLATNAMLEALVKKAPRTDEAFRGAGVFLPWQADLLAEEFLKVLTK